MFGHQSTLAPIVDRAPSLSKFEACRNEAILWCFCKWFNPKHEHSPPLTQGVLPGNAQVLVSRCTNGCYKKKKKPWDVWDPITGRCCHVPGNQNRYFAVGKRQKKSRVWGFRSTEASPQPLEMLQAYARLPLRPTVHEQRARGASNALLLQEWNTAGYNVHLRNVSTFSQEEISSASPSTPHPPRSLLLLWPEFERRFRLGFVCFWECLLVPEGGKRRWHKAETVTFRSGKLEGWVGSNSSKYRHQCVWSVLTDGAALEQSRPDFPRVVSQIKGFALDSEFGVTAVWRSDGDPNGDVVGVKKNGRGELKVAKFFVVIWNASC